jgi:hypothetical protein
MTTLRTKQTCDRLGRSARAIGQPQRETRMGAELETKSLVKLNEDGEECRCIAKCVEKSGLLWVLDLLFSKRRGRFCIGPRSNSGPRFYHTSGGTSDHPSPHGGSAAWSAKTSNQPRQDDVSSSRSEGRLARWCICSNHEYDVEVGQQVRETAAQAEGQAQHQVTHIVHVTTGERRHECHPQRVRIESCRLTQHPHFSSSRSHSPPSPEPAQQQI